MLGKQKSPKSIASSDGALAAFHPFDIIPTCWMATDQGSNFAWSIIHNYGRRQVDKMSMFFLLPSTSDTGIVELLVVILRPTEH